MTWPPFRMRRARGDRAARTKALREAVTALGDVMRATERDFLQVGGKLEEFIGRARRQAEILSGMPAAVGGDRGYQLVAALEEVRSWADAAGRDTGGVESLESLLPVVKATGAPLRDLKSTVRTLRVMGILTRVENARLGSAGGGFGDTATEVGTLADDIDRKADSVLEAVDALCSLLGETRAAAAELERRQRTGLLELIGGCAAGIQELRSRQQQVAGASRDAEAGLERVVAEIGELVAGLQFHDSTRQRLEHVGEALTDAARLQAAHLEEARRTFVDRVAGIRADLSRLADAVDGFARTARELSGGPEADGQSFLTDLEERYRAVGSALREWAAARQALAAGARRAGAACASIGGFIAEIEVIGARMLRLALNAEVQADQLAAHGAVMGAVAGGIRGVSASATAHAAAASDSLRGVADGVGRLADQLGRSQESLSRHAGEIGGRVEALAAGLHAGSAESRGLLTAAAEGSE